MGRKSSSSPNLRKLTVGSEVRFHVGPSKMKGLIVEDRGRIGKAGRHLLRIKVLGKALQSDPGTTFELPADELTLAF